MQDQDVMNGYGLEGRNTIITETYARKSKAITESEFRAMLADNMRVFNIKYTYLKVKRSFSK